LLLMSFIVAIALPAHGGDEPTPRQRVGADPARAKAQEAERQRLIAKLRSDAPKLADAPPPAHALAAPIFHRYDRR
jgi:hypothetical protein